MKDRVVQFPHRYQLVPVAGETNVYDFVPVPGTITEAGTPLNKATLLSDETAALYGLTGEDATVDRALRHLLTGVEIQRYDTPGTFNFIVPNDVHAIGVVIAGGGGGGGGGYGDSPSNAVGGGGGGGGYVSVIPRMEVENGSSIPVVVGSGGEGGAFKKSGTGNAPSGGVGGSSSFNGIVALGGDGGQGGYSVSGARASASGSAMGGRGANTDYPPTPGQDSGGNTVLIAVTDLFSGAFIGAGGGGGGGRGGVPQGQLGGKSSYPVSFNDETCSAVDAQRKRYQIDDPDLMYWDPTHPVLVEVNGSSVSAGFTLEHAGGYIVFNSALDAGDEVTVSGKAFGQGGKGGDMTSNSNGENGAPACGGGGGGGGNGITEGNGGNGGNGFVIIYRVA